MRRRGRNRIQAILFAVMVCMTGCGQQTSVTEESTVDFGEIAPGQTEPVIIRTPQTQSQTETEEETQTQTQEEVTAYADLNTVQYDIESAAYEDTLNGDGQVKIIYPQLKNMENADIENTLNENIRQMVMQELEEDGLSEYELEYEIATRGTGVLSVIFRGYSNYEGAAYPSNLIRTLNLDLTTGRNLRLKDYADLAQIVSGLETSSGYEIISEGVDSADFAAFLNNGYVTDYAMTLLDYDVELGNTSLIPAGYSAIRDNRVVLFVEVEHAIGDYVEIIFDQPLTD